MRHHANYSQSIQNAVMVSEPEYTLPSITLPNFCSEFQFHQENMALMLMLAYLLTPSSHHDVSVSHEDRSIWFLVIQGLKCMINLE